MTSGIQEWFPETKDFRFIRANRHLMSAGDFADYFKVSESRVTQMLTEMGLTIDFDAEMQGYALCFFLERWKQACQWSVNKEWWQRLFEFRAMVMG